MIWLKHMELDEIDLDAMEDLVDHVNETELLNDDRQDDIKDTELGPEEALKEKIRQYEQEEKAEKKRLRQKERKNCAVYGCAIGAVLYPVLKNIYGTLLRVFHTMPYGLDASEEFRAVFAGLMIGALLFFVIEAGRYLQLRENCSAEILWPKGKDNIDFYDRKKIKAFEMQIIADNDKACDWSMRRLFLVCGTACGLAAGPAADLVFRLLRKCSAEAAAETDPLIIEAALMLLCLIIAAGCIVKMMYRKYSDEFERFGKEYLYIPDPAETKAGESDEELPF